MKFKPGSLTCNLTTWSSQFLGDQELLILAPSEAGQRRLLVALPLDDRPDWFAVGSDLATFLTRYFDHEGEILGKTRPRSRAALT